MLYIQNMHLRKNILSLVRVCKLLQVALTVTVILIVNLPGLETPGS